MPRMIEMIRNSQVPSNLMHTAARGALSVPPAEMIEILVHLALHNKVFREQARMTLAGWDEKSSIAAAADPRTSTEVLEYLIASENLRISLLPALAENPSVKEESLMELAVSGPRSVVEMLFASERVKSSPGLLGALRSNPNLRPNELAEIEKRLAPLGMAHPAAETAAEGDAVSADEEVLAQALAHYLAENEAELAAEGDKPFQPIGMIQEGAEGGAEAEATGSTARAKAAPEAGAVKSIAAAQMPAAKIRKPVHAQDERRDTTLRKIAKLDVKGRIALAVRGNKEERSILIRDGTKLVALAVLDSPKVTDGEVEGFALQKNVLEAVLRGIPLKRRFAKNYNITRNLVYNPRTPLDLALSLMKNLLVHDLKNLSANKEISDTIRKLALRMFKQKAEKKPG